MVSAKEALPEESAKGAWPLAQRVAVGAGAAILIFLVGYVPSCVTGRENDRLQYRVRLADLRDKIGMASYEVNRNNYASSAEFSGQFFDGLMKLSGESSDELKQRLDPLVARRDEITTNLAQADPVVKEKLAQIYATFFQISKAEEGR